MNTINVDEPSNDADSAPMTSSRSDMAYGTRQATGDTSCEDNIVALHLVGALYANTNISE